MKGHWEAWLAVFIALPAVASFIDRYHLSEPTRERLREALATMHNRFAAPSTSKVPRAVVRVLRMGLDRDDVSESENPIFPLIGLIGGGAFGVWLGWFIVVHVPQLTAQYITHSPSAITNTPEPVSNATMSILSTAVLYIHFAYGEVVKLVSAHDLVGLATYCVTWYFGIGFIAYGVWQWLIALVAVALLLGLILFKVVMIPVAGAASRPETSPVVYFSSLVAAVLAVVKGLVDVLTT